MRARLLLPHPPARARPPRPGQARHSWDPHARAERATRRIIGATVVAEGAGDAIVAASTPSSSVTLDQITTTWAPYLTMNEDIKLVAQTFDREIAHLSCCAYERRKRVQDQDVSDVRATRL